MGLFGMLNEILDTFKIKEKNNNSPLLVQLIIMGIFSLGRPVGCSGFATVRNKMVNYDTAIEFMTLFKKLPPYVMVKLSEHRSRLTIINFSSIYSCY